MGPLVPGVNLLDSDRLLFKYCLFRRVLEYPFFNNAAMAAMLGANVTPTSQIVEGISEFEAVSVGPFTSAGGRTSFKCVDLEGNIHPISIASTVNSGHTTFFPGCVIEEGVQLGNETSVPMEHTVPKGHQLQVRYGSLLLDALTELLFQHLKLIYCKYYIHHSTSNH